jgi:hypothetical protein
VLTKKAAGGDMEPPARADFYIAQLRLVVDG